MKQTEPITQEEFDLLWLQLNGQLTGQGGVPDLFADGAPCDRLYAQVTAARERLARRTGISFEDHDLLDIIRGLEEIGRRCALQAADCLLRRRCFKCAGKIYN